MTLLKYICGVNDIKREIMFIIMCVRNLYQACRISVSLLNLVCGCLTRGSDLVSLFCYMSRNIDD